MKRYRDFMSKGECLVNAALWTVILVLQVFVFLFGWHDLSRDYGWTLILLVLIQLTACSFHWYRYLAYDKR